MKPGPKPKPKPPKKPHGRPTVFTGEVQARILRALEMGNTYVDAANFGGVNPDTFGTLIRLPDLKDPQLREFVAACHKMRSEVKANAVGHVIRAGSKDWKASAWFLAVTDPKNYGPQIRVVLEKEFADAVARLEERFGDQPDVLSKILDALSPGSGGTSQTPSRPTEALGDNGSGGSSEPS